MKYATKATIASLLLMSGVVHADRGREEALREAIRQLEASLDTPYQQCIKTAKVTNDFEICLSTKANGAQDAVKRKYEAKLEFALDHLKQRWKNESAKVPDMLKRSQTLWEMYAETECSGLYEQSISGTIRGTVSADCQYRLAIQRLSALDEWF